MKDKLAIICACRNPNTMLANLLGSIAFTEKVIKTSDMKLFVTVTSEVPDSEIDRFTERCRNMGFGISLRYEKYHFATNNNAMAYEAISEGFKELLFTNDDVEMTDENTVSTMRDALRSDKDIGTIGLYLKYPDNTVQHIGFKIVVNTETEKKHIFDLGVTHNYLKVPCEKIMPGQGVVHIPVLGNTFAFIMMKADVFKRLGGLNTSYKKCFEDVELNLRAKVDKLDNRCVVAKSAIHLESKTRGPNDFDFLDICRLYVFLRDNLHHFGKL